MDADSVQLSDDSLKQYDSLVEKAVQEVSERFFRVYANEYAIFGERGKRICRDDIRYHISFLRPCLKSGNLRPYVEYLHWLSEVLQSRRIPAQHIADVINWLAEFYQENLPDASASIQHALRFSFAESQRHLISPEHLDTVLDEIEAFEQALLFADHKRAVSIVEKYQQSGKSLTEISVH